MQVSQPLHTSFWGSFFLGKTGFDWIYDKRKHTKHISTLSSLSITTTKVLHTIVSKFDLKQFDLKLKAET